jgi:hypothetical protein
MCIARVKEMNGDLWAVECERCQGNPARRTAVRAPHRGQKAAIEGARTLAIPGCPNVTVEIVLKPVKRNIFDGKPTGSA